MSIVFNLEYSGSGRISLTVYPELLSVYYPQIGKEGVILWLFMAFKAKQGQAIEAEALAQETRLSPSEFDEAFAKLIQHGLVSVAETASGEQCILVHDPEPKEGESVSLEEVKEEVAAAGAHPSGPPAAAPSSQDPFGDLLQYYEAKVGWVTPKICTDLAKWVDDGMEPAVIKEAVDEMIQKADSPRYPYLNAILVSWHQNGWRTMEDLQKARRKKQSMEGVPNAAAYKEVSSADVERIRRWKELYPDEYDA
ncbi:MAG: DnaD domain protein [Firmicutes bacterium]|nr:DnaD domain protein [Bacillota bacterium]